MKIARWFVALAMSAGLSSPASTARPETSRRSVSESREIQGYPCAKGYAWFYADDRLERCFLSRETQFGEAKVPAGSVVVLLPDGRPNFVMLAHDSFIGSYKCRGGGPLGPTEGDSTAFYPSGKLKQCWLADDETVQGVPCKDAGGFLTAIFHPSGFPTDFYETGRLRRCTLSKDYGGKRRGDVFTQAP